jgi:hypothetical protein
VTGIGDVTDLLAADDGFLRAVRAAAVPIELAAVPRLLEEARKALPRRAGAARSVGFRLPLSSRVAAQVLSTATLRTANRPIRNTADQGG